MTDPQRASGSCLCGAVRFTAELPSLFCAHCHCTLCQRQHGAAYVTWFAVPPSRLSLDGGAGELTRHASSEHGTRSFCKHCGSSLFCESSQHPDRVDIVLANMHDAIDLAPQMHVYWSDRAEWVVAEDGLPRLGGETGTMPISPAEDAARLPAEK